ncbi:MAG: hypothetical protein K2Q21_01980 [Chitinophagaceae bacterium]|nr:hypothetical protein [Chitinophagaceae bacterium]
MKKLLLFTLLLSTTSLLFAQKANDFTLSKGTKLIYNVEQGTKNYQFIMTITELSKSVSFNWEMTSPVNRSGSISMTADAMKSAYALFNYFSGGPTILTEETSVFISSEGYHSLIENKSASLSVNGIKGSKELFKVLDEVTSSVNGSIYLPYSAELKGKSIKFDDLILENADGNKVIRVWKNATFPLILFMKTNFKIYLANIEQ